MTLPDTTEGRDVATLVRDGVLRGFSVEFRATRDRIEGGNVRVVERAELRALSVVDDPSLWRFDCGSSRADRLR